MMLPMSMLPGLAPDLAWCLGLSVPKECRGDGGRTLPKTPSRSTSDHIARTRNMIHGEITELAKREDQA